jgi:hypothetical protein
MEGDGKTRGFCFCRAPYSITLRGQNIDQGPGARGRGRGALAFATG